MTLTQPKRKPIYAHLSIDAKSGLDQIAKYQKTTLTNLIEEGARLVINNHLKKIHVQNVQAQQMRSTLSDW